MEIRTRLVRQADIPALIEIYAPFVENSVVSFETEVPTVADFAERIAAAHDWLVAETEEEVVGYAYGAPFHRRAAYRWSVEVSIYLGPPARGRGLGRTLMIELLDRLTARGFVNAFAGTTLPNDASVGLFESLGFERIALQEKVGFKLGAWHDVGWWEKALRERTVPPPQLQTS